MKFREIKNNVFYCGLNDRERKIFDELIPLEQGTSYNSYLVKGSEKIALIDTMYPPKSGEYLKNLDENNITKVDYIIANHGEQDHTGTLPELIKKYPEAVFCQDIEGFVNECFTLYKTVISLQKSHNYQCEDKF